MTYNGPLDLFVRETSYTRLDFAISRNVDFLLEEARVSRKPILFVNAYSSYLANRDSNYLSVLTNSICLLDGKPLSKIVSRWSKDFVFQTRGVDFFSLALESYSHAGQGQLLFGSTEIRCDEISKKLMGKTGRGIEYICPPFQSINEFDFDSLARAINNLKPKIVWVALGTPKQDFVAGRLATLVDAAVVSVGAAFDFYAQPHKESPIWMRALYLEWLFRLIAEPKRLGKRYLIGNPAFILDCVKWRIMRSRGSV